MHLYVLRVTCYFPYMHGIFNIDKPQGMTSHDVVARVRRITRQRKSGHAGTLDPMATGVLPVVLGKATRLVEYLADEDKAYRAVVMLGATSDTYDREGTITPTPDVLMSSREQVEAALEQFRGEIEQVPPMHSAIKVGGKKLYELARAGVEVERQPRRVTITRLDLEVFNPPTLQLSIECSKGTYIRSLAYDLGAALGTGAYLQDLTRTRHGPFALDGAITLEGLEAAFQEDTLQEALYPPEYILRGWRTYTATAEEELAIRQGKTLALSAPAVGEQEMLAAKTRDEELLAVLYWDAERGVWQPRKVFGVSTDKETPKPVSTGKKTYKASEWWGTVDERTVEEVIQIALDKKHESRDLAFATLDIGYRKEAIPALIQIAGDAEDEYRVRAIELLGKLQAQQAVEVLISLLGDKRKDVCKMAVYALGSIGDETSVEPLLSVLSNFRHAKSKNDRSIRRSTIFALGGTKDSRAVTPLIEILNDKDVDKHSRATAAYSLGIIAHESSLQPLIGVLLDKSEEDTVRVSAAWSVRRFKDNSVVVPLLSVISDKDNNEELRRGAINSLVDLEAVSSFASVLRLALDSSEAVSLRQYAVRALGEIGYSEAIEPLIAGCKADEEMRPSIIGALGAMKDTRALEPLVALLTNSDNNIRVWVVNALAELGSRRAIEPLRSLLYGDDGQVDFNVLHALCRLGDQSQYDLLIEMLQTASADERYTLIQHVGELGDPRSVNVLSVLLETEEDHDNRAELARALEKLGDPCALPSLLKVQEKYRRHIIRDWGMDAVDRAIIKLKSPQRQ